MHFLPLISDLPNYVPEIRVFFTAKHFNYLFGNINQDINCNINARQGRIGLSLQSLVLNHSFEYLNHDPRIYPSS